MQTGMHALEHIEDLAGALPPFPKVVRELLDLLNNEEVSLESMAHIARNDAVISGNIISTANHIRRLHAQSDLADPFAAAYLIGLDRLRHLVLYSSMNRFLSTGPASSFFFGHSLAVAIIAQELAALGGVAPDKAYVAGILHDIGQLCFQLIDDAAFQEVYRQSIADGRLIEREAAVFGVDHCQIGARLAEYWNLPDEVLSTILTHHTESTVTSKLQATVCLAETLARALDIPSSPRNRVTKINTPALDTLGLAWNSPQMRDCFGRSRARFRQAFGENEGHSAG